MTISMYQASVPVFAARLEALSKVLRKGEASAVERKIDPSVFITARLSPDMRPLTSQVQIATDQAKGAAAQLAGRVPESFEDNETSFDALQERLARTLALLATFKPEDIDGSEDREIRMKLASRELTFAGTQYLLHFVMPNFYFHVTTAYAILRHNGVPIGKMDFMGA